MVGGIKTISDKTFYGINAFVTAAAMSFLIWLIYFQRGSGGESEAVKWLPAVNAALNATSASLLIVGRWAIARRRESLHRMLMLSAFVVSSTFLVCYIYYHSLHGDTKFLGEGWIRPVYFAVLISHILLSMVVFPMILTTLFFALTDRRGAHRRIARWTFPMWLYVSVTGVLIFFLLRNFS